MSERRNPEETLDHDVHRQQPASPSHESPRNSSQQEDPGTHNARAGPQRIPGNSPDHFDPRFPRFQQPALSPITSPGIQEVTRLLSRDSPGPRTSMSPKPAISRTSATNLPPPSLRRRLGSAYLSPSPDPTRTWRGLNESRKGSIAIGATSGRDSDAISRRLSLGGVAPLENPPGTQNYVEPGYAILNPAYEQPANVRPVWSLAKPLPHVLGPAILPSKNELRRELLRHRDEDDEFDQFEDPELGGRHPTLRSDNISNDLDNIRRDQ